MASISGRESWEAQKSGGSRPFGHIVGLVDLVDLEVWMGNDMKNFQWGRLIERILSNLIVWITLLMIANYVLN